MVVAAERETHWLLPGPSGTVAGGSPGSHLGMKNVPEQLHSRAALCATSSDLVPAELLELSSSLFWNH